MKKILRRQDESIPWTYLLLDLLGAYILTMILLLLLAWLLYQMDVTKEIIEAGITFTYMITCFLAGNLAGIQMKQKRFLWGILMGIAYYVVLILLSILINQTMGTMTEGVTTLILCVGGGMLGGMLS